MDILGAALATNSVWVNGALAERKGEYFRRELQVGNGNGPLWTNVTVASGGVTNTGGLIVPDDRQVLLYDLDGNLTFDGTWTYEWDGENRPRTMTMTNVAGIANSNRLRLEFVYDYQGRRVEKVVKRWTGSQFTNAVTNRSVYDLPAAPGADKVAAWFVDSGYDGRTFCVTQAFFPDRSAWDKLARTLKGVVEEAAFAALSGTVSLPFAPGPHRRAAVKVIAPRGNEVLAVHRLDGKTKYG